MKKKRTKYTKGKIGKTRVMTDSLPSPDKLELCNRSYAPKMLGIRLAVVHLPQKKSNVFSVANERERDAFPRH